MKRLVLYRFEDDVDFSFGWFSFFVLLHTTIWFGLLYFPLKWIWPDVWQWHAAGAWWQYVLVFAGFHLLCGFFEFFFHRYLLHSIWWRPFGFLARKHREHHSLTHVRETKHEVVEDGKVPVRVKYPIVEPEQIESSTFPGYALATFLGIFSPAILGAQALLPEWPVVVPGYLAIVWSFYLYEVKHAIEHLSWEHFWKGKVEKSRFLRALYGFHLMHHSRVRVNQAISGFFGLPIPDVVFRTYFVPEQLPLPGALVTPESQEPPKPCRFIVWLDRVVDNAENRIKEARKREALKAAGKL